MELMSTAQLLGNFGEFVGAVAVVATLGYLAVQIRNNTRTNQVIRVTKAQDDLNRIHEQIAGNEALAELVARCRSASQSDLSPSDHERVERIANIYLNVYASMERAYREHELAERDYREYCGDFQRIVTAYSAFVPKMRTIMEHFDLDYLAILHPLRERQHLP